MSKHWDKVVCLQWSLCFWKDGELVDYAKVPSSVHRKFYPISQMKESLSSINQNLFHKIPFLTCKLGSPNPLQLLNGFFHTL